MANGIWPGQKGFTNFMDFAEIKNISNFFTKYVKTNLLCLEGSGSNTFDSTRTTYTVDH